MLIGFSPGLIKDRFGMRLNSVSCNGAEAIERKSMENVLFATMNIVFEVIVRFSDPLRKLRRNKPIPSFQIDEYFLFGIIHHILNL